MHLDECHLLKCSKRMLYLWDGFGKKISSYPIIMMTRSYNGMLMHTNNSISIFIFLYFDLNSMFYCASLLERTYFTCLALYFSWILVGCMCPCSTYHYWRISSSFHYIVGVHTSLHVCIGICVKIACWNQSKLEDVYCFYM
jgi:hypothetical protein